MQTTIYIGKMVKKSQNKEVMLSSQTPNHFLITCQIANVNKAAPSANPIFFSPYQWRADIAFLSQDLKQNKFWKYITPHGTRGAV